MTKKRVFGMAALLITTMLTACSTQTKTTANGDTYCTNEAIISQLKNDAATPEFVLEGKHYELPMPASTLTEQGFTMTKDKYENDEILLQAGERISVTFEKDGHKLSGELVNDGTSPCPADDTCQLVQISIYESPKKADSDFFVTTKGITLSTSAGDAKNALKDMTGYSSDSAEMYLLSRKVQESNVDILTFSVSGDYTRIKIAAANPFHYPLYVPMEEKQQETDAKIADFKSKAEKEILPYADNFAQIVNELDEGTTTNVSFYSKGTILGKTTGVREEMDRIGFGEDASFYIAQDDKGQTYCIYEGYLDNENASVTLPAFEKGDEITLWGSANLLMELEDNIKLLIVYPEIIEQHDEMVFINERYQVK